MVLYNSIPRRSFLALAGGAALLAAPRGKHIPVGLELYSVRGLLKEDLMGTVRAVAKLGYEGVEFYAPYFDWTVDYAKQVRKLLDDLGIRCHSTHNSATAFSVDQLPRAIELNRVLGSRFIVMASAGKVEGLDGWKAVADLLNRGGETMKSAGLRAGYHNHKVEFMPLEGKRPIEVIAANTSKDLMLQFDAGTCMEAGSDPVAWIEQNPGRIQCIHCKDWSADPAVGYKALFGEGAGPWKKIFQAAEARGGVEYYLIEQEESTLPPMESVTRSLANFRKLHG